MAKRKTVRSMQLTTSDAALLAAVRQCDVRRLRAALAEGANPSAEDEHGPALGQAVHAPVDVDALVMSLVEAGADLAPLRDALPWALFRRNVELARKLVAAGADVNAASLSGAPLQIAARCGYKEIADALIAAGADLNAGAPLVAAIKEGHSQIAVALIEAGAAVDVAPAVSNVSPLAQAVASNDLAALQLLIEKGADLNQPSKASFTEKAAGEVAATPPPAGVPQALIDSLEKMRNTIIVTGAPLTLAVLCGHAEAARLLVEAGADLHRKDAEGLTPYECAMRKGRAEVAEVLRAAGGERRRDTLDEQLLAAAESGAVEEVRSLIDAGAAIEARDARKTTDGRTPLMLASGHGHADALTALIAAGANVNATDEPSGQPGPGFKPCFNLGGLEAIEDEFRLGRTALMFAAAGGHIGAIRALISAGADVNYADFASCTALYQAARAGQNEAVAELLKSGAKVNARGPKGGSALVGATLSGSSETIATLLAHGAKVNVSSRDDGDPLEIVCRQKRADLVKLLCTRGDSKPDAAAFASAFTAIMTWNFMSPPTEDQVLATIEALVEAGADVNAADPYGSTPLGLAVGSKQPKLLRVVARLIELGADVNARESICGTLLHSTVVRRNIDAAKLLFEHGADVQAKDDDGKTVLQFARKFYNKPDEEDERFLELLANYAGKEAGAPAANASAARPEKKPTKTKPSGKKPRAKATVKTKNLENTWKAEEAPSPDFTQVAGSKKYLAALDELEWLCGTKRQPLGGVAGAFSFHVPVGRELDVAPLQERLLKDGAYVVAFGFSSAAIPPQRLLCFPTTDKYDAVAAMRTEGPNYELATGGILHWLRETEKRQPFILTGIGSDCLAGEFITGIRDAETVARRMIEFCPGIEDGFDDEADFADDLGKSRRFSFWWD